MSWHKHEDSEANLAGSSKASKILFSKNKYGPKTKVEFWTYEQLSEKKDNYVYRDHLSNQVSTYHRLGSQDIGVKSTETSEMLEQIHTKKDPVIVFRPLVNFTSYPCTDTPGRNKLMKHANLPGLPPNYGITDYVSTQQKDYRNPHPKPMRPLTMPTTPWILNRVIRSNLTDNNAPAPPPGENHFFDSYSPIDHIRSLKLSRYKSFDPGTSLQNFPDVEKHFKKNESEYESNVST